MINFDLKIYAVFVTLSDLFHELHELTNHSIPPLMYKGGEVPE
jgi:hypothetical protein